MTDNPNLNKESVIRELIYVANDIDAYLQDESIPIECYREDIGLKLQTLIDTLQAS